MNAKLATTHDDDCLCVPCMTADFNAHIESMGLDPLKYDTDPKVDSVRTRYAKPGQRTGNGIVRTVSPKQVALIKRLMVERDTTNLVRLPGSEDVENMSLRGARDLIDRLFACPEKPRAEGAPTERMATPKQLEWLVKMANKEAEGTVAETRQAAIDDKPVTFAAATAALDVLFKAPYRKVAVDDGNVTLTLGLYRHPDGRYVRVQKARTGNHYYGKVLDRENGDAWNYTPGSLVGLKPEHKMSIEDVNALSLELGSCGVCGRTLTATVDGVGPSARVIGPICAAKQSAA